MMISDLKILSNGNGQQEYKGIRAKNIDGLKSFQEALKSQTQGGIGFRSREIESGEKVPYGHLAKNGTIEYNGVIFICDYKNNAICLGDMSNKQNVLNIPLSKGGVLRVNRDSLGALSAAIGMFSPEDVNLILRAITQDKMCRDKLQEIEENKNSIGREADKIHSNEED